MVAISGIASKYLHWPSRSEKMEIVSKHKKEYGLPDCLGFMDGSLIPLFKGPGWHQEKFFSRKMNYAMQSVFICDSDLQILYVEAGHYGSTNNPGVLSYGLFASKIEEYFEGDEYVIGDSAYKREPWCIPVKKPPLDGGLSRSDEKFNYYLSHARVRIEHCFAALKGRFASLEELRTTVNSRDNVRKMDEWVQVCAVLHNFCLGYDTPSYISELIDKFESTHNKEYFTNNNSDDDDRVISSIHNKPTANSKWEALKQKILEDRGYDIYMLDHSNVE
ncbi:hypothetical protein INT46_003054 [Mucor plumbeus]|uniref:DDE Tnp4 domain-containing protein n=1 Tax=Mucor plumbeus TaxID=97098 RepID=A0A8H7QDD6_9FUNG|nr:hypothetical protein INT46_003054 [Mucor plumbeus]